jgi:MFS transporter, ACS family, D-galactonate transporter
VESGRQQQPVTAAEWRVLALLVLSICLNYIDRTAFAAAAPTISAEFGISPVYLGLILSAFFWLYPPFQIVSGWMVDRFNVSWVLGAGFLLWSLVTGMTGFAHSATTLLLVRVALGAAESPAYPSYGKIIAMTFPENRRGICNSLIEVGNQVGPALATLLGGLIVAGFGWRALFFSISLVSLLWIPAWIRWAPRPTGRPRTVERSGGPSFAEILRHRSAWGTFLGLFAINYVWIFLVTWLPSYLVMERHFSTKMMAIFASVPFWGLAVATFLCGWLSDRWITRGGSPTVVRKIFTAGGLLLCTVLFLPAVLVGDPMIAIGLLTAACLAFGMTSSNVWTITQTIAGAQVAGRWTGMQNAIGNLAGVVAPWLTGLIVARTGAFYLAFVLVCVFSLAGAVSLLFLVGRVEPVQWDAALVAVQERV